MKDSKLTKLIEDLGMKYELKYLLESPEDYSRFEKIVNDCLELHKDNPPQLKIFRKIYNDLDRGHIVYSIRKPELRTYARMIKDFKMYYGIDVEKPMKKAEISRYNGVSRQIISKRINYLLAVLSRHKRDIWYDML